MRGRPIRLTLLTGLVSLLAWAPAAQGADAWALRALGLQYELASDVPLRNAPWVYTHNSFNSQAEMGPTLSDMDPNQRISIVDQLDEGVRHLEIDVYLVPSPSDPRVNGRGPVVCHATGPGAGCTVEKPFKVILGEIRDWMRKHPDQVLLLYFDADLDSEAGYAAGADDIDAILGDVLVRPPGGGSRCAPMPLGLSRDQIRRSGKRALIIGPCGVGSRWQGLVFDEGARATGALNSAFRAFPDCGPDFKRTEYDARPIRYYEDATQVTETTSRSTDPVTAPIAARMIRCGVDLIGFDFLAKSDPRLDAVVWSWARGQPRGPGTCSIQRADSRWEARACTQRHRVACRDRRGTWRVPKGKVRARSAARLCGSPRFVNGVPRTGYEGQLLRAEATQAGGVPVWLGQRRTAGGWEPRERKGCGPTLRRPKRRFRVRGGVATIVVRLRFRCTGERLGRRITVRGGLARVRSRTGRRIQVRVARGARKLRVSYGYRGRTRTARVLLRR